MSTFPTLKTRAVVQYPAQRGLKFSTTALQFVDGSEQRFGNYQAPLHEWVIALNLLDQSELHQFQEFFRTMTGAGETFAFTDPWDGVHYPNCRIESDTLTTVLATEWKGKTSVTVRENRS